jgi:hypothetical protein
LEAIVICEDNSTNANGNKVILYIYSMMKGGKKVEKTLGQYHKIRRKGVLILQKIQPSRKEVFLEP